MHRRAPEVVTTVDLPSGKTLEVVCPADGVPYTRVREENVAPDRDLSVCEECRSDLVEPYAWQQAGPALWRVGLYCPNCDHSTSGVFSQACVDRFDECLDDATAAMVSDLKHLGHARMSEDVERFIAALDADAIVPDDF